MTKPLAKISDLPRLNYSLAEVAASLGRSLSTVKKAVSHGRLAVVPMGNRNSVTAAELQRASAEGLGKLPPRYNATTDAPKRGGRKSNKQKADEAKAARRKAKGEARANP
jgi:hypothetical protein